jgi:uncharacterized membrane protein YvbJ
MICKKCGAENSDQNLFCNKCGTPLNEAEQPQQQYQQTYQQSSYQQPSYQQPSYQQPTSLIDNTPISMWGYFGYQLLFSIPCIGFICLLIFSLGGTKNVNLKNFARSYFCYFIIVAILLAILLATGTLGSLLGSRYY